MAAAPTRPVSWVLAPFWAATAVRDPLVLTGNPWKKPAAIFAAPTPIISRSPSTSAPVRAANADAVEIVSVNDTTTMPSAPAASSQTSSSGTVGTVNGGNPWGIGPTTVTPWSFRSNRFTAAIASTTATRTPGMRGSTRWKPRIRTRLATPTARAAPAVSPSAMPRSEPGRLVDQAVGVDREAEELGQLAHDDGESQAVHVADLGRLGQELGDEPELEDSGEHGDGAHHQRQQRGVGHRAVGISVGCHQWDDRRRDHGAQRGVRAEHQHPGRPEDRVPDETQDGRVEPGDGWQAGQLGVGHPLRHEQRGQDQTRDKVLAQPPGAVGPHARDARYYAEEHRIGALGSSGHGAHRCVEIARPPTATLS